MSSLKTRLEKLEEKLQPKQKNYFVVNWNTGKADNDKAKKQIEAIKKNQLIITALFQDIASTSLM